MNDWNSILAWGIIGLFLLLSLYTLIHMLANRLRGKDEIEELFVFMRRKK